MNTEQIKNELSLEINRLQQARNVLAGIDPILPKRRGRPSKMLLALLHAGAAEEPQSAPSRAMRKKTSRPAKKVAAKAEPVARSAAKKAPRKRSATKLTPAQPAAAKRKYTRRAPVAAAAPLKTRGRKAAVARSEPAEPLATAPEAS